MSAAHNERGIDLLVGLLETMSVALGFDFDKVQLRRRGYYPQGHADEMAARLTIQKGLAKVFNENKAIPMSVVSFPFSEEATRSQLAVQEAILKALNGDSSINIRSIS